MEVSANIRCRLSFFARRHLFSSSSILTRSAIAVYSIRPRLTSSSASCSLLFRAFQREDNLSCSAVNASAVVVRHLILIRKWCTGERCRRRTSAWDTAGEMNVGSARSAVNANRRGPVPRVQLKTPCAASELWATSPSFLNWSRHGEKCGENKAEKRGLTERRENCDELYLKWSVEVAIRTWISRCERQRSFFVAWSEERMDLLYSQADIVKYNHRTGCWCSLFRVPSVLKETDVPYPYFYDLMSRKSDFIYTVLYMISATIDADVCFFPILRLWPSIR